MNEQDRRSTADHGSTQQQVDDLRMAQAVQAASMAGQAATTAATFAGTWSTIAVGASMLIVGMFLGMAMRR